MPEFSSLVCAVSRSSQGNMSLYYGDTKNALNNRRDFLQPLGIDYRDLVCAKQVHGKTVRKVRLADRGRGALSYEDSFPDTDAFITDELNVSLAIFTADCLSVFLFDPVTPAVGLVHAGWKGTKERVTACTVDAMKKEFNSKPQDLYAAFGPAIRNCCYEVEDEFRGFFPQDVAEKDGRLFFDIASANRRALLDSGVTAANITDSGICTFSNMAEFFSFRGQADASGRMISVIMLK
jgi:polyphenol oxidase